MNNRSGQNRNDVSYLFLFGFFLLLASLAYLLYEANVTRSVDRLLHDGWVRLQQRVAPEDVVVVGIDEESLDRLGRWPWPRDTQRLFFERLADAGVKIAVLDLLYVEPDSLPSTDRALARAIDELPLAVLPVLTVGRGIYTRYGEKLPVPEILSAASGLGHIFLPIDADGIVRRVNLMSGFRSAHWPALGATAFSLQGGDISPENLPGNRMTNPEAGNTWVGDYEVLIPFYGPARTFTNISFEAVFSGTLPDDALRDKIVFIGATATGIGDVLPTAVSSIDTPMPGVEIHANIFAALRDGTLVTRVGPWLHVGVTLVLLLILLMLYPRLTPFWGMVSAGALALVPVLISYLLYASAHLWYPPLVASVPILVSYFFWSWHRLDFVSDFLLHETKKLEGAMAPLDNTNNKLLADFFESASMHLPLEGWSFSASGQQFKGGDVVDPQQADLPLEQWQRHGQSYSKRYATPGKLLITFRCEDTQFAQEFIAYVDSLSRVRERKEPALLSGSIERMQINTYRLSNQLDRLQQLNVLSDSIFNGSPAGLVVWSGAGELMQNNELAGSMLPGMLSGEGSLREFLESLGFDPAGRDRERMNRLLLERESWQINRIENDQELVISFSAVGESLANRLISASIVDVTDIRRNERSRNELIDFLSHDLRSPLISSLYMLADDLPTADKQQEEKKAAIETNINRSLTMMDDLLNLARADNLTAEQFSATLFDSIVDNAIAQLLPQASTRQITIENLCDDDELWIDADASLLERALVNVISNAIKYSPDETTVTVRTWREENLIACEVQDQGIGIAPEMMSILFQRFKRDAKVSGKVKGIGLGLALVSRVVTQHGGKVWARSPGVGTAISMRLPLAPDLDAEHEAPTTLDSSSAAAG